MSSVTTAILVAGLVILPAIGIATWIWLWLALARVEVELLSFNGFEGMHFED